MVSGRLTSGDERLRGVWNCFLYQALGVHVHSQPHYYSRSSAFFFTTIVATPSVADRVVVVVDSGRFLSPVMAKDASQPLDGADPAKRAGKSALKKAMPARPEAAHLHSSKESKANSSHKAKPYAEVPFTEGNLRRTRKSRGEGVREQGDTVMELIDTMRYGKERRAARSQSQVRERGSSGVGKSARVESSIGATKLRVHWARFKQRLGTGSAPSESLLDGTGTGASSTSSGGAIKHGYVVPVEDEQDEAMEVDQIVVDNDLGTTVPSETSEAEAEAPHTHTTSEEKRPEGRSHTTSFMSDAGHTLHYLWDHNFVFSFFRWTLWPLLYHFFSMQFGDLKMEHEFRKESWWSGAFYFLPS